MIVKPIRNEKDLKTALARIDRIIDAPKGIRISFTIHKSAEYYSVGLYNAAGKCISRKTATGVRSGEEHNEMFNVHANGLYFVRIGWPEGSISNRVLINN